jgi:hypothetical protein
MSRGSSLCAALGLAVIVAAACSSSSGPPPLEAGVTGVPGGTSTSSAPDGGGRAGRLGTGLLGGGGNGAGGVTGAGAGGPGFSCAQQGESCETFGCCGLLSCCSTAVSRICSTVCGI